MDIDTFIQRLPKAEIHLHLEGTIPWQIASRYAPDDLPLDAPWLHPDFCFDDFDDFSYVMRPGITYMVQSVETYAAAARDYFKTLVAQNVRYVEVSIGINVTLRDETLNPADVVAAIYAAAPPELTVRLIVGINRRFAYPLDGPDAKATFNTPGVVGIDLHGDERESGPHDFADIYRTAYDRGYLLRAHAGELTGPQTIWDTLDTLGVSRIEHGTTAIYDDALIDRLIQDDITLDMCPTSNVKLGVVDDLETHPIGDLMRRGVRVTCSTDDPGIFGVTLTDELRNLVEYQGFTARELAALQINAFEVALLSDLERIPLMAEVRSLLDEYERANA